MRAMRDDRDRCSDWVEQVEILGHWGETAAWQSEALAGWAAWLEGEA